MTGPVTRRIPPSMRSTWIPATALALVAAAACSQPAQPQKTEPAKTATAPKAGETPKPVDGTPAAVAPVGQVAVSSSDKLIPGNATLLAHVDIQGLASSPLWTANKALMESDPEVKKQLDALAACNMPMTGFKTLDLGVDAEGINVAAVLTGAGVGKPENLQCMQDQMKGESFRVEERDGKKLLVLDGGEAFGHMVNDDTLAFTTKSWDATVRDLIAGKGSSVRDGGLKDVLAQADQSKHVWFAGTVSPQISKLTQAIPGGMSGLESIAGSLDLTAGLALVMSFGMENADRANATLAQVQKQFADVKPMAGLLGLPTAAVDRVQFNAKESAVTMTASLSMDEINTMRSAVEKSRPAPGPAVGGPPHTEVTPAANAKGNSMPKAGGDSAPTGASPTPSASGVPASDSPQAPAPKK